MESFMHSWTVSWIAFCCCWYVYLVWRMNRGIFIWRVWTKLAPMGCVFVPVRENPLVVLCGAGGEKRSEHQQSATCLLCWGCFDCYLLAKQMEVLSPHALLFLLEFLLWWRCYGIEIHLTAETCFITFFFLHLLHTKWISKWMKETFFWKSSLQIPMPLTSNSFQKLCEFLFFLVGFSFSFYFPSNL